MKSDRRLRTGEKLGWIGGWVGAFCWIPVLAILFAFRGQQVDALVGLGLTGLGVGAAVVFSPWRYPRTRYWRLMVAPYFLFMASLPWAIRAFGVEDSELMPWWVFPTLVPMLLPVLIIGRRRWCDG